MATFSPPQRHYARDSHERNGASSDLPCRAASVTSLAVPRRRGPRTGVIGSGKFAAASPGRAVPLSGGGARASGFLGQDAELVALGIGECDPAAAIGPPVISKL